MSTKRPRIVESEEPSKRVLAEDIEAANEVFGANDTWVSGPAAASAPSPTGKWIPETPITEALDVKEFMDKWADKVYFEECKKSGDSMRYLLYPQDAKLPTKSFHLLFKNRDTLTDPVKLFLPSGKIKNPSFAANVSLTDEEYAFFKRDGVFCRRLCGLIVADPARVLGADHPWTAEIAKLNAKDEAEAAKLVAQTEKRLKLCETDEEKAAERAEIESEMQKCGSHQAALDFVMSKYRDPSQVSMQPDKKGGFYPPSWKCKINGVDLEGAPYPAMTVYCVEDGKTALYYHQDKELKPPGAWAKEDQLERHKKQADAWEEEHQRVVAAHPDGLVIKPYSRMTWVVTVLGIAISQGIIDVSTRVSQAIRVGDGESGFSRPIGEPSPCAWQPEL